MCRGDGSNDAVVVSFLSASALDSARAFYDEASNPLWRRGRQEGWLDGRLRRNFFLPALYRGVEAGPPPLFAPGMGLSFCGHGLTVGFPTWSRYFTSASADEKHAKLDIMASAAGPLTAGSTELTPPGPGVPLVSATWAARQLAASFTQMAPRSAKRSSSASYASRSMPSRPR